MSRPPRGTPTRTFGWYAVILHLLVAAMLFSLAAAFAQTPSGGYRIAGKVVNADSGSPLAGAEVAIVVVVDGTWGAPSQDTPRRGRRGRRGPAVNALQAATTGDDGAFSFEHVPAGKYSLQGSRRGFITASYEEHGMYSTAIVTGAGIPSENLTLRLSPGAVIGGNVVDSTGDPLERAQVSLYRLSDDGLGTIRMYQSKNSDDLGAYEFAHLSPGTYFVSSTASVWYAQGSRDGSLHGSAASLDLVYPRSFYADATDSSAATPVPIRGGEHLHVDLHMQAVPAVHLTYALPNAAGPSGNTHIWPRQPMVTQSVFGVSDGAYIASTVIANHSEDGRQSLSISVAPGTYDVEMAGRSLSVNASGDAVLDPQTGALAAEVTGRIAPAVGAALPETFDVTLEPAGAQGNAVQATVSHDGTFHFDQVRSGAYEVTAQASGAPITIVQMAASGGQLEGHVLKVGTQPVALAATAAPASAILYGFARAVAEMPDQQGPGVSGAMVVMVPKHLGDHALYRRDQSDSDGSFTLRQVAAGSYTVLAIRDGWDLDWAQPEVIAHYLAGGQVVTVSSADTGAIHLAKPITVQAR